MAKKYEVMRMADSSNEGFVIIPSKNSDRHKDGELKNAGYALAASFFGAEEEGTDLKLPISKGWKYPTHISKTSFYNRPILRREESSAEHSRSSVTSEPADDSLEGGDNLTEAKIRAYEDF
jgi:hypothetical protein